MKGRWSEVKTKSKSGSPIIPPADVQLAFVVTDWAASSQLLKKNKRHY